LSFGVGTGQPAANGAATDGNFTDVSLESDSMLQMMTKKTLLHGTLNVWLYEARRLPNMDLTSERLRQCFSFLPSCKTPFVRMKNKAKEHTHGHHPKGITSDPYASVVLASARVARTRVISNNASPTWNEHFKIPVAHYVDAVEISIKDDDMLGAQYIGSVTIPVERVIDGQVIEGWHDVLNSSGNICHEGAQCRFKLVFSPVQNDPLFTRGVGGDGHDNHMVPDTYFPCRKGCDLTLYQDAHIFDGSLPEVMLEDGVKFHQHRCWEELCTAILDAHHMVYIAGWSIYHQVKLLRDTSRQIPEGGNLTLGELLKRKSAEGVRVLVLAWDDKTSHNNIMIKNEGLMGVHDEDTKRYFKNTAVRCVLAPRYGDSKLSWFRQQVVGTLYTHHQKLVIMDTQGTGGSSRKLTSFIGGLDLCDGRWDTPTHSLFATLQTLHKNDYHDPTFSVSFLSPRSLRRCGSCPSFLFLRDSD
jgi:phospholipase D1/2